MKIRIKQIKFLSNAGQKPLNEFEIKANGVFLHDQFQHIAIKYVFEKS